MNKQYDWSSIFIGQLDEENAVFVNTNNEIQFKIEILSEAPADFPLTEKSVNGFSRAIAKFGFIDDIENSSEERIDKLIEYLKEYYIFFKVVIHQGNSSENNIIYYNAVDIELRQKESYNFKTFVPIPFFRSLENNAEDFIQKLVNSEFISGNYAFSLHEDDVRPFVIISENPSNNTGNDEQYSLVGTFHQQNFQEKFGVKFSANDDSLKRLWVKEQDFDECYLMESGVAFLTNKTVQALEEQLHLKGENIKPTQIISNSIEKIEEDKFLDLFEEVCLKKGLVYSLQDLYNFHTAMKTQGLVILSGMSGTGKSQLVQCYYDALYHGINNNNKNFLFVPVRPFWQDDSDLLGYLDTLNGIYRSGESGLVDFIIEANKNEDECYIVCLDEMNLARVEHYFAQFLSVLERDPNHRYIQLYNSTFGGRVFNENQYPPQIKLGENLFFVGTINTDESTFRFSDKVLDRANIISLNLQNFNDIKNRLRNQKDTNQSKETNKRVTEANTYIHFQGMQKINEENILTENEINLLWELHKKMNEINRNIGIGMRIVNQIEDYLINLPDSDVLTRRTAFDLQITQRILTKLRGSDDQLLGLVGKINDNELVESEIISGIFEKYYKKEDFENSIRYLEFISKELEEYGHTI